MPTRNFNWNIKREAGQPVVFLSGALDEGADFDGLAQKIGSPVCFDVKQVSTITSMGIRAWIEFIKAIEPQGPHSMRRCPPFFVTQMNMIPNFTGSATVESVLLPYFCPECHAEKFELYDLAGVGAEARAPEVNCSECDAKMAFDDLETRYFAFLHDPEFRHPREPGLTAKEQSMVGPLPLENSGQAILLNNVAEVLEGACLRMAPATISLSDMPRVLTGVVMGRENDVLTLALHSMAGLSSAEDIRLGQHCVVTLHHNGRPVFFLTTINDYVWASQDQRKPELELGVPKQIAAAEVRRALRVPIPASSGVDITLSVDRGIEYSPVLRNLSTSGMLVEFSSEEDPRFPDYDRFEALIKFETHIARLRATVCRKEAHEGAVRYGISFPEISALAATAPPVELSQIVAHFEARWVKQLSADSA